MESLIRTTQWMFNDCTKYNHNGGNFPKISDQDSKGIMPVLSFGSQVGRLWILFIQPPLTAQSLSAKDQQFSGKKVLTQLPGKHRRKRTEQG